MAGIGIDKAHVRRTSSAEVLTARTNPPGARTCAGWACFNDAQKFGIISSILFTFLTLVFIYWFLVIRSHNRTEDGESEFGLELGFIHRPRTRTIVKVSAIHQEDEPSPVGRAKPPLPEQPAFPPAQHQQPYPSPYSPFQPVQPPPFAQFSASAPGRLVFLPPPPPPPFANMVPPVPGGPQQANIPVGRPTAHPPAPLRPDPWNAVVRPTTGPPPHPPPPPAPIIAPTPGAGSIAPTAMIPPIRQSWSKLTRSYEHPPPGKASTICDSDSERESSISNSLGPRVHSNTGGRQRGQGDEGGRRRKRRVVCPEQMVPVQPSSSRPERTAWRRSPREVREQARRHRDRRRHSRARGSQGGVPRPAAPARRHRPSRRETSLSPAP